MEWMEHPAAQETGHYGQVRRLSPTQLSTRSPYLRKQRHRESDESGMENGASSSQEGLIRGLRRTHLHEAAEEEDEFSSGGYVLSTTSYARPGSSALFDSFNVHAIRRPQSSLSSSTEPDLEMAVGMHYAETRVPKHNNVSSGSADSNKYATSMRYKSQYFSNANLFQEDQTNFNYLKYAKAKGDSSSTTTHPHLRVSNMGFDHDPRTTFDKVMLRSAELRRLLMNISFEMNGEYEAQMFVRTLAGTNLTSGRVHGAFELNGHRFKPKQLADRVAFIPGGPIASELTLREYMDIYSRLVRPATINFNREEMIEELITGLALTPFKGQLVENLGKSELQRLKLATSILLDTGGCGSECVEVVVDILVAENVLKDMDLYDLAFFIDYVRNWAQTRRKIVIIAVTPPTLEILTMFEKVAVLTCGRLVFFGHSCDMVSYFEHVGYTSPSFKNPCDYYVDLVTHDILSHESSRESMARIRTLTEIWGHKAPPLHAARHSIVSPKVQHAGPLRKTLILYRLLWHQTVSKPILSCWQVAIQMLISLVLGWVFFQIPLDRRSGINDRQGVLCALLVLLQIPICLMATVTINRDWPSLCYDLSLARYSRLNYLIAKLLFDLPMSVIASIAYTVPAYVLLNQNPIVDSDVSAVISFWLTVMANSTLFRYLTWSFCFMTESSVTTALWTLCTFLVVLVFSGFVVHPEDQFLSTIQYLNPVKAAGADLLRASLMGKSYVMDAVRWTLDIPRHSNRTELSIDCHHKKILASKLKQIPIYTVSQCLKTSGSEAYLFSGFAPFNATLRQFGLLLAAFALIVLLSLLFSIHQRTVGPRPNAALRSLS